MARELLTESGSVFVQIGDENVHLVRSVLDEVFGSENFVSLITFKKTTGAGSPSGGTLTLPTVADYVVWYARDRSQVKYRALYREKEIGGLGGGQYTWVEDVDGGRRRVAAEERDTGVTTGRFFRPDQMTSQSGVEKTVFDVEVDGTTYAPAKGVWKTDRDGMGNLKAARRLMGIGKTLCYVRYFDDFRLFPLTSLWDDTTTSGFGDPKVYVVQTNIKVVERCLMMTSDPGDLVLDPTCGSGTTAYCAEKWGRRWITIDTSRVALALARTRLMAARFAYYLLADSPAGQRKEAELTVRPFEAGASNGDVRKGFVYRRVPHIMLRSIANNPDIRPEMTREEIEAAIARNAEQELLLDQPYEAPKHVRVSGPFTVESLSPHRVSPEDDSPPASEETADTETSFTTMVLENLRKAGVQNTVKQEHLDFGWLEPYAGTWVHAQGEFVDSDGETRRAAVSLGPEHATVGADQVKEAAKEALKGAGFDLLLVCAFSFDAHAGETAKEFQPQDAGGWAVVAEKKRFGKLPVLLARINPDLSMGDDLLKKTGAGNLFMVFGEPDVEIERTDDGMVAVEIRGVDVYDPTTGQLRSSSVDDIACWFIDTNYNGESFFVRDAYFTGAEDPYAQLKRALRADIDEDAWATLYRTRSRPFDLPDTGRIAVKVD